MDQCEPITPEAERILGVFRERGIRAGGFVHFTDFGEAIQWESGFIRDEAVRHAVRLLVDEQYVVEMPAGLELAQRGDKYLGFAKEMPKHGARVYRVGERLLVKQTVLRGNPPEYVIDQQRERHVGAEDDHAIATAIREALDGRL
jgi:hypothetical protein